MNLKELYNSISNKSNLYIKDRKIKIIQVFDMFDICEIIYLDKKEKETVDIMGITGEKENNKYISLNRLGGN